VGFGGIEIVFVMIEAQNRCLLDLSKSVGVSVDQKVALAEQRHGPRCAVILKMSV
jgi:hypothetical protein